MHRRRLAIVTMAAESAFTLLLALLSNETTEQLFCYMLLAYAAFTLANLGKVCARLDSLERVTARLEQTSARFTEYLTSHELHDHWRSGQSKIRSPSCSPPPGPNAPGTHTHAAADSEFKHKTEDVASYFARRSTSTSHCPGQENAEQLEDEAAARR